MPDSGLIRTPFLVEGGHRRRSEVPGSGVSSKEAPGSGLSSKRESKQVSSSPATTSSGLDGDTNRNDDEQQNLNQKNHRDQHALVNKIRAGSGQQKSDNNVRTARYTWWNFLPLVLYTQFTQVQNCFFLFITCVQCVTWRQISLTDGKPVAAIQLVLVVCVQVRRNLVNMKLTPFR